MVLTRRGRDSESEANPPDKRVNELVVEDVAPGSPRRRSARLELKRDERATSSPAPELPKPAPRRRRSLSNSSTQSEPRQKPYQAAAERGTLEPVDEGENLKESNFEQEPVSDAAAAAPAAPAASGSLSVEADEARVEDVMKEEKELISKKEEEEKKEGSFCEEEGSTQVPTTAIEEGMGEEVAAADRLKGPEVNQSDVDSPNEMEAAVKKVAASSDSLSTDPEGTKSDLDSPKEMEAAQEKAASVSDTEHCLPPSDTDGRSSSFPDSEECVEEQEPTPPPIQEEAISIDVASEVIPAEEDSNQETLVASAEEKDLHKLDSNSEPGPERPLPPKSDEAKSSGPEAVPAGSGDVLSSQAGASAEPEPMEVPTSKPAEVLKENLSLNGGNGASLDRMRRVKHEEAMKLGRIKSGRFWKGGRDRFSSVVKSRGLKQKQAEKKRIAIKQQLEKTKEYEKALKEEVRQQKEELRLRREENEKRRRENERKAEVVQKISNVAKLKKMKKKQLRSLAKRDLTQVRPGP